MSQLKLTADSGGGTVAIKGPASTTGNAALEMTVPSTASGTLDSLNRAGNILQVIYVQKSDTFSSSAASWTDITGLTADITMSSASNKVLVTCHISGLNDSTTGSGMGLKRNDSFVGLPSSGYGSRQNIIGNEFYLPRQDNYQSVSFSFLDTPGTGTHTYKVVVFPRGYTVLINRSGDDGDNSAYSRGTSDITLMEVAAEWQL